MAKKYRHEMVAEEIKKIISEMMLTGEFKVPEVDSFFSISDIKVVKDL